MWTEEKKFVSKVIHLTLPLANSDPLHLEFATSSFIITICLIFAITLVLLLQQWEITLDDTHFEKILDLWEPIMCIKSQILPWWIPALVHSSHVSYPTMSSLSQQGDSPVTTLRPLTSACSLHCILQCRGISDKCPSMPIPPNRQDGFYHKAALQALSYSHV